MRDRRSTRIAKSLSLVIKNPGYSERRCVTPNNILVLTCKSFYFIFLFNLITSTVLLSTTVLSMEDCEQRTDRDVWNPSLVNSREDSRPLEVRFNGPAKHWTDALPIGNGHLGAMIWGGVQSEILNLNGEPLLSVNSILFVLWKQSLGWSFLEI